MVGPMEGFADAWGSMFLVNSYNMEQITAHNITLAIFLGMCIGCFTIPYICDKYENHYFVTIIQATIMFICFCYILSLKASISTLYYLCIIIGICCSYQVIMIAKISSLTSSENGAITASICNMIIMFFGWVFHNIIGYILSYSQFIGENGVKIITTQNYIYSLSIIPIAILAAIFGLMITQKYIK